MNRLLSWFTSWTMRREYPLDAAWSDLNAFMRKAGYR